MAKPQRKHYTWDDLVQMSEPEDGKRYEILEGDLVVTPAPLNSHQFTVFAIGQLLAAWSNGRGELFASPVDVILAPDTVCEPDVFWISPERVPEIVGERVYGIPDLVVEVLSPSTSRRDRIRKAEIYAKHGAREYWLASPLDQTLEMRRLQDGRFVQHTFGSGDVELVSSLDDALRVVPARLFRRYPKLPPGR